MTGDADELRRLTADVVAAHTRTVKLDTVELTGVIRAVYETFAALGTPAAGPKPEPERRVLPAVAVEQSVSQESIVCLHCGATLKTLKRHLGTVHRQTPAEYRNRWGLPADYPLVAPEYSQRRRAVAERIGLGHHDRGVPGRAA